MTDDAALELGRNWLGDPVEAISLYGEYDLNFRVADSRGERYVLKVMRDASATTRALVELQIGMLDHLAAKRIAIAHPRPIRTLGGHRYLCVQDATGAERIAWMLSFVEGELLDAVDRDGGGYGPHLLRSIGHAVAEVDRALVDYCDERADRAIEWDLAQALTARQGTRDIDSESVRRAVETVFAHFETDIVPRLARLPRSIIHNDGGNQHNMIVGGDRPELEIRGLIDFGDAVRTQTICGLGVAAAYGTFGSPRPGEAIALATEGYARAWPLTAEEAGLVPWLAAVRLAISLTVAARRAVRRPHDAYASVSARPASRALELLLEEDLRRVEETVRNRIDVTRAE